MAYYYDIHTALNDYPRIDCVLYLHTDPKTVYERLLQRGRKEEEGTPEKYLNLIHKAHELFLPEICDQFKTPLITIEWNNFGDAKEVAKKLNKHINEK